MRQWVTAAAAVALALTLVGCSGPVGVQAPVNPLLASALAKWKAYPADQIPRPIVWLRNGSPVNGFSTDETRIAAACGFFTLGSRLPNDYPAYGRVTWRDGASSDYLSISAAAALWFLSRGKAGMTAQDCASSNPLVIKSARLGTFDFDTDRGKLQAPAWLFAVDGAAGELAYPAITSAAFWKGGMSTDGYYPGVTAGADGRSLISTWVDTPGGCATTYQGVVAESASAVAIRIQVAAGSSGSGTCRAALGQEHSITVTLARRLGGRVVVNESGDALPVCPAGFTGRC